MGDLWRFHLKVGIQSAMCLGVWYAADHLHEENGDPVSFPVLEWKRKPVFYASLIVLILYVVNAFLDVDWGSKDSTRFWDFLQG